MPGVGGAAAVGLAIFAGALVAFVALALLFDGDAVLRRRRERRLATLLPARGGVAAATPTIRRRLQPESVGWRALVAGVLPFGPEFDERLAFTGVGLSAGRYRAAFLVAALLSGVAALGLTGSRGLALLALLAVGLAAPRLLLAVLVERRRAKFLLQFPDAIDLMIRSLRAGFPVDEAIGAVASEGGDAVAPEFRRVRERLTIGETLEDSLWRSSRRLALPDLDFFIICLTVQRETGGNLTETLANLGDILRRRLQMRLKVKAMSAEARTSATIIGGLPFLLAGALHAANPAYLAGLFGDPRGQIIVATALASEALGIVTMIRMARFRI